MSATLMVIGVIFFCFALQTPDLVAQVIALAATLMFAAILTVVACTPFDGE